MSKSKTKIVLKLIVLSIIVYLIDLVIWLLFYPGLLCVLACLVVGFCGSLFVSKIFKERFWGEWGPMISGTIVINFIAIMAVVLTDSIFFS